MSEALSSSEIEDVLSSIRRLVSDDLRPKPGALQPAAASGEKLILTPALRVVEAPAQPDIEAVVTSVAAAVDSHAEAWESETGDQPPLAEHSTDMDWQVPAGEAAEFSVDDGLGPAPVAAEPDLAAAFEVLPAAELEPQPAEVPPPDLAFHSVREDHALPGWAQQGSEAEDEAAPVEAPMMGTVEPDPRWADAAEAEVLRELHAGAMPRPEDDEDELSGAADREMPFDEDVLREIVRDIIREEFQGRLGERITRNIRKLVRAEIARVLAAEDLT